MSIAAYTDTKTHTLLDDAVDQLAHHRGLSLDRDTALFSVLGSLARQLEDMIEHAIAETDLGGEVSIEDIADLLDINPAEARHRYTTELQPF